jgi:ribose transport system substrate-binding protein
MPRSLFMRLVCLAALAAAALPGCEGSSTGDADRGDGKARYRIAVIPKGTTHEFWKSVHAGAVQAALELQDVEILYKGPLREDETAGQIQVVQDFIAQGVDGICLAPLDSQALIRPATEAIESDIPVVVFDSALGDESQIVSYVATDNFRGGRLAAQRLGEAMGGQGDVILLRYKVGSESTEQREEGFLAELKENHPDVNVLVDGEYAGTTPSSALEKATQLLRQHRDAVDGIFAVCEPNADGTLGALRNTDLAGRVKFVAFDPSPTLIQGMKDGNVHGIVLQDPVGMGYKAVMAMHDHLSGKPVEKRIQTGEHVATPENMDTPEIQKLLTPPRFGEEEA